MTYDRIQDGGVAEVCFLVKKSQQTTDLRRCRRWSLRTRALALSHSSVSTPCVTSSTWPLTSGRRSFALAFLMTSAAVTWLRAGRVLYADTPIFICINKHGSMLQTTRTMGRRLLWQSGAEPPAGSMSKAPGGRVRGLCPLKPKRLSRFCMTKGRQLCLLRNFAKRQKQLIFTVCLNRL